MTVDETKARILIKTAIEFNAVIMSIAIQVLAAKNVKARQVERELSRKFEDYQKQVQKILEAENE